MRNLISFWICAWAGLNCIGWLLSAVHELNPAGYVLALVAGLAGLLICRRQLFQENISSWHWRKFYRRFCRPLPAVFLIILLLVLGGGMLYPPDNYDALTYRLPRILNWLTANGWHWIATSNLRMNYSTPAWEWTALPQLALLHSDRGLFLINFTGFLLLPGLLFSVFRQLGVVRQVAWTWMWLLPLAYGYSLQAGSIGNDMTGAVFCLASVDYGLRARGSRCVSNLWLSLLAAALLTGNKLSNLPLLLPCLAAVWPALPRLREHWRGVLVVLPATVLISAAPIIVLNQIHIGNWSGDPGNKHHLQINDPVAGLLGNGLLLAEESFMPPILPKAEKVSGSITRHLPRSWQELLTTQFPRFTMARLSEIPAEEGSGLGIGISLPLAIALLAALCGFGGNPVRSLSIRTLFSVGTAAWVAFAFFLAKMGSEAGPRILLAYYPLIIAPLLMLPAHARLLRFQSWHWLLLAGGLSVLPAMILSPSRPLWPAAAISQELAAKHPRNAMLQRMAMTYAAYAHRNDALAPLKNQLPADARDIGFAALSNDSDYSLWRPFGRRRVIYMCDGIDPEVQLPPDVEWLVVKRTVWPEISNQPLEEWAADHHAKIVFSTSITTLVSWGPQTWCLLHVERALQPAIHRVKTAAQNIPFQSRK